MQWTNIKANNAKCRYTGGRYNHHDIPKGDEALLIEGDASGGGFKIHFCEEHALEFLRKADELHKEYWNVEIEEASKQHRLRHPDDDEYHTTRRIT